MPTHPLPPTEPLSTRPLVAVMDPFTAWLAGVDPALYTAPPPGHQNGSLGGHTRHTLDHLRALLAGRLGGVIDYDARQRDTPEEQHPAAACAVWAPLREQLLAWDETDFARPVTACCAHTANGTRVAHPSTLGREVGFVFSHTVHHLALIAFVARAHGLAVPHGLGMAPSTAAFQKACAPCAR